MALSGWWLVAGAHVLSPAELSAWPGRSGTCWSRTRAGASLALQSGDQARPASTKRSRHSTNFFASAGLCTDSRLMLPASFHGCRLVTLALT